MDNKLPRVRARVGAQLRLTCTGGNRCVSFDFAPPVFSSSAVQRRPVGSRQPGKRAFSAGRLALHNTALPGRRKKKKKGDMHPVFPRSLCRLYYISVCVCAHNKQNLLSIFTYPNNGICAYKLAGEPNIPHRRFQSYRFCLCAICALKIFFLTVRSHLAHFNNYSPSVID